MDDRDKVIILKPKQPKLTTKADKAHAVTVAKQSGTGQVSTQTKYNASSNKQHSNDFDVRKLDKDEGDYAVKTITPEQSKRIIQLRNAKGLTQKELANAIQETASVVAQYEQGKAIPNQKVLSKMEKALGGKIRGYVPGED